MKDRTSPKFLIVYRCKSCDQESAFTEHHFPHCRTCGRADELEMISKRKYTSKAVNDRLIIVAEKILLNLRKAYDELPKYDPNMVAEGDDAELRLLRLMHLAKTFKERLEGMEFDD